MRHRYVFTGFLAVAALALFLWRGGNVFEVRAPAAPILEVPEAGFLGKLQPAPKNIDLENQKPLPEPPETIKAVYATSWSASNSAKLNYLIDLIKTTELNAIVIDVKAFDGVIAYDIQNEKAKEYLAKEIRIPRLNSLIKRLHDEDIYIIARITVFQDPVLARARPDLAVQNQAGETWKDNKGLAWMDPASREVWDYNIAVARDAAERGFDELNFDYIRFPSDGNLDDMEFPFYDPETQYKKDVIESFFEYLRSELYGIRISADLFGLATINKDDLGIGQVLEAAFRNFDYVSPMIYPSHYARSFIGFENPAAFPYEVVKYSMDKAVERLVAYRDSQTATSFYSQIRPWLQDFDLGADYDVEMVRKEIQAVYDSAKNASSTFEFDPELVNGWMLWNPSNVYTKEALELEISH